MNALTTLCSSGDLACLKLEVQIRRHRVITALAAKTIAPSEDQLDALANVDEALRRAGDLIELAVIQARRLVVSSEERETTP